ncbi:hypothetical protein [Haliscomenobacter sp.]|uniref:hypothetical protein n=1 Tax=Haliscomenobacter sp. TaxID=2717303 RepID=UPI00359337B9
MLKTPLSRSEVAIAYGITTRTLYNWIKDVGITRKGGRLTIPECELLFEKYGKPTGIWEKKEKAKR